MTQAEEQLRAAVERHRAMEEQLTALVEASATLTASLDSHSVSASILKLLERLIPADAYAVWRLHHRLDRWQIVASSGLSHEYQWGAIEILSRTPGMPDRPVVADDVFALPMLDLRKEAHRAEGIRSMLAVPLRTQEQVHGTLVVYYRQPHHFSDIEIGVATAAANLATAAIASADVYMERKRAEQDARFLADASEALAGLVDYESTLQKVARLAVPTFADWCTVDMLDEGGTLRRLAVAHVDPSKVELAHELHRRYPADPSSPRGVYNIVRTGKSQITTEITDEMLVHSVEDPELLRIIRELGLKSHMAVPLAVRGKVLGVLTFIGAESGRRYTADDLTLAEDLAHRAAVAIESARLYQEVREEDRRKNEFLALLGHELRNPLAPIRNALSILKLPGTDGAIAEKAREMMERQVEYMVRLVDDLLDVARIVRGKVELRREPVELSTIVARAVETAQPVIAAEGHRLTVSLPSESVMVHGDLVRLAQVASNLLNNAAKYTEPGGQIWLTAAREADQAVLRVRDTGIGIAPEQLPRLFVMFFQAERRTRDSQGGLGIGLSLVRGLVELHGGMVEAHSAGKGMGSEFVIRLPLLVKDKDQSDRSDQPSATPGDKPAPRRLLVVDDNVDAADSLAMLLRLQGHEVEIAYDGPTALAKAEANPPVIAFLDLGMPKMDGYQLARQFRERPALRNVQLVALTGWGQPEDRQRTQEAGFDRHLVKPVEVEGLNELFAERP